MIDKENYFAVRLKSSEFKTEQQSLASDDEDKAESEILAGNLPGDWFPVGCV